MMRILTNTVVVIGGLYAFHTAMRIPGKHLDEPTSRSYEARLAEGPLDAAGGRDFAVAIARAGWTPAAIAADGATTYASNVTRMEHGIDEMVAVRTLRSLATPCDNGPNSPDAVASPSVCPAVVTRLQRDGLTGKMDGKACLPPVGVDPARLVTTVAVDFPLGRMTISSTFDGAPAPECTFTTRLPYVREPGLR